MDQEMKIDGIRLDVSIDPNIEKGKYSNMTIVEPSDSEVFISFLFLQPTINGVRVGEVQSRVVMTPISLKKTLVKLLEWLKIHEGKYGKIDLQHNGQSIIDAEII